MGGSGLFLTLGGVMGMGKAVGLIPGVLDLGGMRVVLPGLEPTSLASCPVQLHREVLFSLA